MGGLHVRITICLGTLHPFLVHRVLVTIQVNFRYERRFASLDRAFEFLLVTDVAYLRVWVQVDQKLSAIPALFQFALMNRFDVCIEAPGFQVLAANFEGTSQHCRMSLHDVQLQLTFCEKSRSTAFLGAMNRSGRFAAALVFVQIGHQFFTRFTDFRPYVFMNSPYVMREISGLHEGVAALARTLNGCRMTVSNVIV